MSSGYEKGKVKHMENSLMSITDQITNDMYSLQSLIIHASAKSRTKTEIQEDLVKMSKIVNRIKKLSCGV